jgi:hypothetical protein
VDAALHKIVTVLTTTFFPFQLQESLIQGVPVQTIVKLSPTTAPEADATQQKALTSATKPASGKSNTKSDAKSDIKTVQTTPQASMAALEDLYAISSAANIESLLTSKATASLSIDATFKALTDGFPHEGALMLYFNLASLHPMLAHSALPTPLKQKLIPSSAASTAEATASKPSAKAKHRNGHATTVATTVEPERPAAALVIYSKKPSLMQGQFGLFLPALRD